MQLADVRELALNARQKEFPLVSLTEYELIKAKNKVIDGVMEQMPEAERNQIREVVAAELARQGWPTPIVEKVRREDPRKCTPVRNWLFERLPSPVGGQQ